MKVIVLLACVSTASAGGIPYDDFAARSCRDTKGSDGLLHRFIQHTFGTGM